MAQEFTAYIALPPAVVTRLQITIEYQAATGLLGFTEESRTIHYRVHLLDTAGRVIHLPNESGDLIPYLTPAQQQQVMAFLDAMLAKAQRLIPTPIT